VDQARRDMPEDHISFDRRIPVAVVLLMIAQIFGFGWYMSGLDARLVAVESTLSKSSIVDHNYDRELRLLLERLARMETQIIYLVENFRDVRRLHGLQPAIPPSAGNGGLP
jgi:hypothetical protein